ncbi:DUF4011 domain-containing protein [Hoeflea alexandrii]
MEMSGRGSNRQNRKQSANAKLVDDKIENLRPKLLDLTARNPLIRTRLTGTTASFLRVVDELPDVLFSRLSDGNAMRFRPLPPLEDEPPEEATPTFRATFTAMRNTDEEFLKSAEALDPDTADYMDRLRKLERALKDRVRESLSMPPRPKGKDPASLVAHARAHGFTPSYDLPDPDEEAGDDRHIDDFIQTLQLPRDLERKLNGIISKGRTWQQETGVNVVQAAFGYLEWQDPKSRDVLFSPLVILPVSITARKAPAGIVFSVRGNGESADINGVLAERLRRDFGLTLPPYEGGSLESYFETVAELKVSLPVWRVRRQIVFGIFPSARIAMYHDLDTSVTDFSASELVTSLLIGREPESLAAFAEDYDVDDADRNGRTPLTVLDADSSQISTLLDISAGKNLAVEGPPGTGKSQTIVNAVAAALAEGKKVLFIAEKLAALDVVRSRLAGVGLGDFILPLQAGRASKEDVINSLRQRLSMDKVKAPRDFEVLANKLRESRDSLSGYIEILKAPLGKTGKTVHEILGTAIATDGLINSLPSRIRNTDKLPDRTYDVGDLALIRDILEELDSAWTAARACSDVWEGVQRGPLAPFEADQILDQASASLESVREIQRLTGDIRKLGITGAIDPEIVGDVAKAFRSFCGSVAEEEQERLAELFTDQPEVIESVLGVAEDAAAKIDELRAWLRDPLREGFSDKLLSIASRLESSGLPDADFGKADERLEKDRSSLSAIENLIKRIEAFAKYRPAAAGWTLETFVKVRTLIEATERSVLRVRNAAMNDPSAPDALRTLVTRGRKLAADRAALLAEFAIATDLTAVELRNAAAVLRNAGAFSVFTAEFKHAKRCYLSIVRSGSFSKESAIRAFSQIADFLEAERNYLRGPKELELLGLNERGLDTDFDVYEQVTTFLDTVNTNFPGPEFRDVRAFLKEGELDLIDAVPDIGVVSSNLTLENLRDRHDTLKRRLASAQSVNDDLIETSAIFLRPKETTPARLRSVAQELSSLQKAWAEQSEALNTCGYPNATLEDAGTICDDLAPWRELDVTVNENSLPGVTAVLRGGKSMKLAEALSALDEAITVAKDQVQELADLAQINLESGFADIEESIGWLESAATDRDGLIAHARLAAADLRNQEAGLSSIVGELRKDNSELPAITAVVEALVARFLARQAYGQYGDSLKLYSGLSLANLRKNLSSLDKKILVLSKEKLKYELAAAANPPAGNGIGNKRDYTQMSLVFSETEKKKRFIPVRDLMTRAGEAILELKPCWMMSPQAVAQYVPKGRIKFDLCIIDEASQMPPEDAIGALYRSEQAAIVGDLNQLPPTNFFQKMLDDDVEEDDATEAVIEESVLEMAKQTFRPSRRLRWHYRSRHSGLIRFSNEIIYRGDLVVFPSPDETRSDMGVSLFPVQGGYRKSLNTVEAQVVIEKALQLMRDQPNRSLGIVTLNKAQADYLRELFDNEALPGSKAAQDYVDHWNTANDSLEPFFIKNLENVQGDERDVIFISTVYGPEKPGGPVAQRFGPINGVAGQRRLNVLFSRAKEQIITFSSMTAGDITASENSNKGVWMLKRWLEYAATGRLASGETTEREPDSDFERHVMEQVRAIGFEPVPQVGVSGYFIDIGVRHPEWPHGFLLGIECDGATYHSGRSARDRDRLREEILMGLGWHLHRIWSTDWFANPRREAEVLRSVISERLEEAKARVARNTVEAAKALAKTAGTPANEPASNSSIRATPSRLGLANGAKKQPGKADMLSFCFDETPAEPDRPPPPLVPVEPNAGSRAPVHSIEQPKVTERSKPSPAVEIGDTVQLRYLTHGESRLQVTISRTGNDQSHGMIGFKMPLAEALLDAEEGEEIEVLVGSYLRKAVIEKVIKGP